MNIVVTAAKITDLYNYEEFLVKVNPTNYPLVRKKIEMEYDKINDIFKELQRQGQIKSIRRPKNKNIKKQLKDLVLIKKQLKKSIKKIISIYVSRV